MKHVLLILPEQSVTGIGIGQWNSQLVAFSGCCRKTIELNDLTDDYCCPSCRVKTKVQPFVNPTLRVGKYRATMSSVCKLFIEQWTELKDVEVSIEWTEE